MQPLLARIYKWLAWAMLGALLLQVYFAGMALFGAGPMIFHENSGYLFWVLTPVPVVLALAGRLGRWLLGLSALLVLLTTVQVFLSHLVYMLPEFRKSLTWVAALHPLNAVAMIVVTYAIAIKSGRVKLAERPPALLYREKYREKTADKVLQR